MDWILVAWNMAGGRTSQCVLFHGGVVCLLLLFLCDWMDGAYYWKQLYSLRDLCCTVGDLLLSASGLF